MSKAFYIHTKRLMLIPFSEMHLTKQYVGWLNDHEVVRFSEQRHKTHTIDSCREFIDSFKDSQSRLWAIIINKGDAQHIGNIHTDIDIYNNIADIAILIGEKQFWGNGYGYEAFEGVVEFLFNKKRIRKITAGALSVNKGMMRIMERIGMQDDGIRKKHYILRGIETDIIHKALFYDDWMKRKNRP